MKILNRFKSRSIKVRHPYFNDHYYKSVNKDLKRVDYWKHFRDFGIIELRNPAAFIDTAFTILGNKERVLDIAALKKHLASNAPKSIIFNADNYRKKARLNAKLSYLESVQHFNEVGWKKNISPNDFFDIEFYLDTYQDIKLAEINPLIHYTIYGSAEGRIPFEGFTQTKLERKEFWNFSKFNSITDLEHLIISKDSKLSTYYDQGSEYYKSFYKSKTPDTKRSEKTDFIKRIFNADYYAMNNPDLKDIDLFWHYTNYGHLEGRKPNILFDPIYYRSSYELSDNQDPIEHYLDNYSNSEINPHPLFQTSEYLQVSDYVYNNKVSPLTHYLANPKDIIPNKLFDDDFYKYQLEEMDIDMEKTANPFLHYMREGSALGISPNKAFDPFQFKLVRDQNVSKIGLLYTTLYSLYLQKRNIEYAPNWKNFLVDYKFKNSEATKMLFVTHDASWTGAPLIIKHISNAYKQKYSIVNINLILRHGGDLTDSFRAIGPTYEIQNFNDYNKLQNEVRELIDFIGLTEGDIVFVNSAESRMILKTLKSYKLSVVTLVHEMAYYYNKNAWKEIDQYSDITVFPSQIVKKHALANTSFDNSKVIVRGQGIFPDKIITSNKKTDRLKLLQSFKLPKESVVVLGCGSIIERKGVHLFVQTAINTLQHYVESEEKPLYFLWLGKRPEKEDEYFKRIKEDITLSGFEDKIQFIGAHKITNYIFNGSDVFFMCSKGDPFPCVVLEAMNAALPVICFDGTGGYCEIIDHEKNGRIFPFGDITSCSNSILDYIQNPKIKHEEGLNAKSFIDTNYTYDSYINDLTKAVLTRPILNLDVQTTLKKKINNKYPYVIFAIEDYWISGVNTVIINTVRGLLAMGFETHVVITQIISKTHINDIPADIPYKELPLYDNDEQHRKEKLLEHIKIYSPCFFLPHTDYLASSLSKELSEIEDIKVIGVLHADDEEHYEHGYQLGRYWDNIVCVSPLIAEKMLKLNPSFSEKTSYILNGIEIPNYCNSSLLGKFDNMDPIKIIYTGRVIQYQKRVLDFVEIADLLEKEAIPFQLTIVGDGPEYNELKDKMSDHVLKKQVILTGKQTREELFQLLKENHVFTLISDFEGLPMSLLEGMAHYCIPLVSHIQSGITDILTDKYNSLIFPIGDYSTFVKLIKAVIINKSNNKTLALNTFNTLKSKKLTVHDMAFEYSKLIEK